MTLKKKLNFLWTLALYWVAFYLVPSRLPKAFGKIPRVPTIDDPKFTSAFVTAHNELRRKVQPPASNMNHLIWDKSLAQLAKSWTRECKFVHNPCTSSRYGCLKDYDYIGENIYLGRVDAQPKDVVRTWYNETKDYTYDNNSCTNVCGHYTQVVWAETLKVGCAVSNCPHLTGYSSALITCNYVPAGNVRGMKPYLKGEPCSMCGENECVEKLCNHKIGRASQLKACNLLVLSFILQRLL